jgi:hypothetical protein
MIKGGPKIINDGLVLCLDAHDAKSYAGEPTTNLIPVYNGGDGNSRFTTDNAWGTYNTNQYNSNQYFSIGTISSVSNNIVTTSSNHPFRTFDAVKAQTSGGGITAGTTYFIKKISDTTFSIHTYNSSQDGSQGYIRSDGYHQVHESIATDTRVSINSTNFPTMWNGPAHLPNTCHVKEIVEGGGYAKGTNCMCIHVTRTVGVDGGMAYGVYTPVTQGDTIMVSYWARCSPNLSSRSFGYSTYFGSGNSASSATRTLTPEWQLITYTWTASVTYNFYQYFYPSADSQPYYVDMADLQVEVNKSYSTPYTPPSSPRSATNGWVDRSGNSNNGTLTNMIGTEASHYRDGEVIMPVANSYLDFDGSDDRVQISHSTQLNNAKSWEIWFKIDSFPDTSTYDSVFSKTANWNQQGGILLSLIYGNLRFSYGGYWADLVIESISNMNTNTWYQVVGTGEDTGSGILMKGYLNGVYKGSLTSTAAFVPTNTNALYLGFGSGGTMNGQIAIFRVYEQTLTDADVLSNYNATKGRF